MAQAGMSSSKARGGVREISSRGWGALVEFAPKGKGDSGVAPDMRSTNSLTNSAQSHGPVNAIEIVLPKNSSVKCGQWRGAVCPKDAVGVLYV